MNKQNDPKNKFDQDNSEQAVEPESVASRSSGQDWKEQRKEWHNQQRIQRQEQNRGNYVGGILLIFIGLTLLLINSGLISPLFWSYIWQYWPVIFILLGIRIFVGRSEAANVIMSILTVIVLALIWNKVLIDTNSSLVTQWKLYTLPWYGYLKNFTY